MRGKQSDSLLRTGITITLSSNYPRSRAAVCISPLTDFPSPRCVNKVSQPVTVCRRCGNRRVHVSFFLLSLIGFLLLFQTAMCLISFFILLLPLPLHLSSIRLQITGAQEDRSGAEEGENRVKGRQLASNGRSRGVHHNRSRTQALKQKQLIDSLVH